MNYVDLEHIKHILGTEMENRLLRDNSKLTDVQETISMFWQIYIMDALLGNFDRHGACLFPNLVDEAEMLEIIESKEETEKRIYRFPTSQVKLNGKKSSYFEVIHSLQFEECNNALRNVMMQLDMAKILQFLDEIPLITDMQRSFYKHMITARYNKILKTSFEKLDDLRRE